MPGLPGLPVPAAEAAAGHTCQPRLSRQNLIAASRPLATIEINTCVTPVPAGRSRRGSHFGTVALAAAATGESIGSVRAFPAFAGSADSHRSGLPACDHRDQRMCSIRPGSQSRRGSHFGTVAPVAAATGDAIGTFRAFPAFAGSANSHRSGLPACDHRDQRMCHTRPDGQSRRGSHFGSIAPRWQWPRANPSELASTSGETRVRVHPSARAESADCDRGNLPRCAATFGLQRSTRVPCPSGRPKSPRACFGTVALVAAATGDSIGAADSKENRPRPRPQRTRAAGPSSSRLAAAASGLTERAAACCCCIGCSCLVMTR